MKIVPFYWFWQQLDSYCGVSFLLTGEHHFLCKYFHEITVIQNLQENLLRWPLNVDPFF